MIKLVFLKVLRQLHQKSVLFATISTYLIRGLSFNWMSAREAII